VEWSRKHWTPAGNRGKQVFGAQWNEYEIAKKFYIYKENLPYKCNEA
jgi:hypothetical protein